MPAQARRGVLIVRDEHTSNDALEQRFRVFGVQVHSAQRVASGCAMLRTTISPRSLRISTPPTSAPWRSCGPPVAGARPRASSR